MTSSRVWAASHAASVADGDLLPHEGIGGYWPAHALSLDLPSARRLPGPVPKAPRPKGRPTTVAGRAAPRVAQPCAICGREFVPKTHATTCGAKCRRKKRNIISLAHYHRRRKAVAL